MRTSIVALLFLLPLAAGAGEADVLDATATPTGDGTWRFEVTVRHTDTGWDHYADAWEVLGPDRAVLGTRTLLHPHTDEQPFTRALTGVVIPDGISEVTVRRARQRPWPRWRGGGGRASAPIAAQRLQPGGKGRPQ